MEELIEFKDIEKGFKNFKVINKLNLTLYKGDMYGLIGPSGAGKSTLLKILIGFYGVDKGNILYQGRDVTKKLSFIRKLVGFCTQENSFYYDLTVQENIRYYGFMYGLKRKQLKQKMNELLDLVGLTKHKKTLAGKISGGMKRRLDFAISLIHDPEILILDEPTTGLDPILRKEIWGLISEINKKGKTVLIITHDIDMIEGNCQKIGILNKGIIQKVSTPIEFRKKYPKAKNFTEIFEKEVKK